MVVMGTSADVGSNASVTDGVDRRMVTLVREAKGWGQRDLAEAAHLNQSTISKVENGLVELRGVNLVAVARALGCPPSLLTHAMSELGLDVTCLHHRRRRSKLTTVGVKKVEGVAHLTRISVEALLPANTDLRHCDLPRIEGIDSPDPVALAAEVRRRAHLAEGPVHAVIATLERLGVIVIKRPLGSTAQDAVSSWPHDRSRPPILIINSGLSGDRQRFTVVHEVGHMIMHRVPGDSQEEEADLFAASLLAPAEDIRPDLDSLTTRDFRLLLELKVKWGMSVAALIRRAFDIGVISDRQYREFHLKLNRLGWRTSEPVALEPEEPQTLRSVLRGHANQGRTMEDLARLALMSDEAFERYLPVEDLIATGSTAEG